MARIDWNLRSRARACMKCARPFAEKETVRSGVVPFESPLVAELFAEKLAEEAAAAAAGQPVKAHPEYVRLDFCEDCRKALPDPGWISVWKGPYVPPETAPEDPLRKATPETLLRSLLEGDDPAAHAAPIYLNGFTEDGYCSEGAGYWNYGYGHFLEMGLALRNAPDGTLVHIYEHRRSGDILLIADPRLSDAEIPGVQEEIERLLGLRPAAAPAADGAAAIPGPAAPSDADGAPPPPPSPSALP